MKKILTLGSIIYFKILNIIKFILKPILNLLLKHIFHPTYKKACLITNANADFLREADFLSAYEEGSLQERESFVPEWVVHVNLWAAYNAFKLDGDFVEVGVYKGRNAKMICDYIKITNSKKKFFLFDTYCGLAREYSSETEYNRYRNSYKEDSYDFVVESFIKVPNVIIVKGVVPDILYKTNIEKVAYLSIDLNCVIPEVEALKYFWPRLVHGALVVLDDYAQLVHGKQKQGVDSLCHEIGTKVLSLPTGQGLIIKN